MKFKNINRKGESVMQKVYKLFRIKEDKLYPLYVLANKEVELGKFLPAKEGVKASSGKVKSKLGELSYRAGWHSSNKPEFEHITSAYKDGKLRKGFAIAECKVFGKNNTKEAQAKKGAWYKKCFQSLSEYQGWYFFKTNTSANPDQKWIISDNLIVSKVIEKGEA